MRVGLLLGWLALAGCGRVGFSVDPDGGVDASADASSDAPIDVALDSNDGAADAGNDGASSDADVDAASEAGLDAGSDAGVDAGEDPATLSESFMPVVRYEFEGSGQVVVESDAAARAPALALTPLGSPSPSAIYENGGVTLSGAHLQAAATASNMLRDLLLAGGVVTVEVWASTTNFAQVGPARIATFSLDTGERAFHIAQLGNAAEVRLRSASTDLSGNTFALTAQTFVDSSPHHVLFSYDETTGVKRLYIDGTMAAMVEHTPDSSLNWSDTNYRLGFGNEFGPSSRVWNGTVYRFAIYDRVLSDSDVQRLYNAGPS